jgi:hypothetical protein
VVSPEWLDRNVTMLSKFAHIVSTVPATALCGKRSFGNGQEGHQFRYQTIRAAGAMVAMPEKDEIYYDGTEEALWHRSATVFGYRTVEWPIGPKTYGLPNTVRVRKPLSNDCLCHPEIFKAGRYGAWRKGLLVHHAYEDVRALMAESWITRPY